jgi:hypothetical protein
MFKDVMYADKNGMLKIFDGFVTVRYYLSDYRRSLEEGMAMCASVHLWPEACIGLAQRRPGFMWCRRQAVSAARPSLRG